MVATPLVWVIDADQWPRAMLRAELIERGFDAVGFITIRDAIGALMARRPEAIVVDARGQPVEQIGRLAKIGVPMIVVAGAMEIAELPEVATVVRRPVSLGDLAQRVENVLEDEG